MMTEDLSPLLIDQSDYLLHSLMKTGTLMSSCLQLLLQSLDAVISYLSNKNPLLSCIFSYGCYLVIVTDGSFSLLSDKLSNWSYSILLITFSNPVSVLQLRSSIFLRSKWHNHVSLCTVKMSCKIFKSGKYLLSYSFKGPTGFFGLVELLTQ